MTLVKFTATPETCWEEAGRAAGQAVGHSPTVAGSQGQSAGPGSQPPAGPRLPRNSGWGLQRTGSSSAPAGRGFPRRKPGGARAAGAAGRGRRRPAAEGSPPGGLDPPPHLTSSRLSTSQNTVPTPRRGSPSSGAMGR